MSARTTARIAMAVRAMTRAMPFSRGEPSRDRGGCPNAGGKVRRSRHREASAAPAGSWHRTTGAADGAMAGGERTSVRSLIPGRGRRRHELEAVLVDLEREDEAERGADPEEGRAGREERPRHSD